MNIMDLLEKAERNQKQIEALQTKVDHYEQMLGIRKANTKYKDRLFKFLFGNPDNKHWTLSLYNAVNNTNYTNPEDIQFNTLGDFLYLKMRNDVSFILYFQLNMWEHQSTFSPNLPMRFFLYGAHLYEKYIATSDYYEYSSTLQPIPKPVCICFYNGTRDQPERQVLKLSDAYEGEGDIEVHVTMLNINYGKNHQLLKACQPLQEYAWLVDAIRKLQRENKPLAEAVDSAVERMPDSFVIKPFIIANQSEVKTMLFTEYNEEEIRRRDYLEGHREGRMEGRQEERIEVATDMLKGGEPFSKIVKFSRLSEDTIRELAEKAGVTVTM